MRCIDRSLALTFCLSVVVLMLGGCLAGSGPAGPALATPIAEARADRADFDTHWLIVGGGSTPTSNEYSLQANFLYYQRLFEQTDHPERLRHYLFADGGTDRRDLKYSVPADELSEQEQIRMTLARLMGSTREMRNRYRPNEVPNLAGPSSSAEVEAWFDQKLDEVEPGDRLVIYFTGHGIGGTDDNDHNTTMQLWGGSYRMQQFAEQLDRLPDDVEVVQIMVQCHSGGFAHTIFEGGDSENGLASQSRIGFFAAIPERLAAGCSPEVDEAAYQDYSTFFWAALFGESRVGDEVEQPDYTGDGQVSFAEAHAYVLLTSHTIDVPMSTSDALLREYSTLENDESAEETLLGVDTSYEVLLEYASDPQYAVLEGLSEQLELTSGDRIAEARENAQQIEQERQELAEQLQDYQRDYNRSRQRVARSLIPYWPELRNAWHPSIPELIADDGDAIMDRIESHSQYDSMQENAERVSEIQDERYDLEKQWAKHKRFIYTAESVLLAANLPHVADADVVERYEQITAAENGVIGF